MKRNFTILRMSLILLLGFFMVFNANAQSTKSRKLSVQGYLKDGNGKAVDNGKYAITFKVYDGDTTTSKVLWTEINPAVDVYGGIYTVQLGATNDISTLAWDKPYFLGISISGTELSPRTELTYAPYAFAVNKANYVQCSGALGDVKYSILNPTQFADVNGDCWVPMDGRTMVGSKLATKIGASNVPNGGGLFLRGQENSFTDFDAGRDMNSAIGTLQEQATQTHQHGFSGSTSPSGSHVHSYTDNQLSFLMGGPFTAPKGGGEGNKPVSNDTQPSGDHSHSFSGTTDNNNGNSAAETRPKNLNFWTYIRIN